VPETPTPDFYTRAAEQLRTANGDDTVVIATLNGEFMHMQTRTPRGPAELVQIARRLLEEARDIYDDEAQDRDGAKERVLAADMIEDALELLPDMNADDDDAEG
jgi:hypothetical protein